MEDLGIQVKAVLTVDTTESVKNINDDISKKVQNKIESCKINLEIDDSKISDITKKINDIVTSFNKIGNINVKNDIGDKVAKEQKTAQTAIQNTINLEKDWIKQRRNYDSSGTTLTSQSTTYKLNDYTTRTVNQSKGETNSVTDVENIQNKLKFQNKLNISTEKYIQQLNQIQSKALDPNSTKAITNTTDISGLNTAYQEAITLVDKLGNSTTETFAKNESDVKNAITIINQYITQLQNAEYSANQLRTKSVGEIKVEQVSGLNVLENDIKSAGVYIPELQEQIGHLKTTLTNVADKESLTEYNIELSAVISHFKELKSNAKLELKTEKASEELKKLQSNIISSQNSLKTWSQNNPQAMKKFGDEIGQANLELTQLVNNLNRDNMTITGKSLQTINAKLREIKSNAVATGNAGKSLFATFKEKAVKFAGWYGIVGVLMTAKNAITGMLSTINELDTALIDLKKTTNATDSELKEFYYTSNDIAKSLGTTTSSVINATSEWSRLGYSIQDATTMAKNSAIFSAISPDLDMTEATDGLVSTMKAFGIEAGDTLDGVISKINIIGNTQAVDNGDIVTILEKSSSAMAEANNSLEQTIALGTAATEITRDADSVGTALKTISMKIRGYDEETESYTSDLENLSGTIADLTKTASTPGGISLFTDDAKTQYKSTYQILEDISKIYNELTDKDQAQLLEALAGKRQGQITSAILSNFSNAEKSMDSMANSSGSAMEEMDKVYESVDYHLNNFKETLVGISQNSVTTEFINDILDIGTKGLELLDGYLSKFGAVKGVIVPLISTVLAFKGKGIISNIFEIGSAIKNLGTNIKSLQSLTSGLGKFDKFGTATGLFKNVGISAEDLSALKEYKTLLNDGVTDTAKFSEVMSKMSPNAKAMAADVESGAISIETLSSAEKAATISTKLLGTAFKMLASIGVMLAINAIISGIQALANAEEEEKNRIEENLSIAKEHEETLKAESKAIDDIISQYKKYSDITKLSTDDKKELSSLQDTLVSKFGEEAKNIDLVNGKYQEQYDLLRGIKVEKASQDYNASNTTLDSLEDLINSSSDEPLLNYYSETGTTGILSKKLQESGELDISSSVNGLRKYDLLLQWIKGGYKASLNDGSISEQAESISQLLDILNEYRDTQEKVEINGKNIVLSDTKEFKELYSDLTEKQKLYTEYSTELQTKAQNAVKKFTFTIDGITYDSSNVTSDIYKTWRENLLKQYENDKDGLSKEIVDYLDQMYDEAEYQYQLLSKEDKRRYDISHSWGDNIQPQSQSFSDWLTDNTDALDKVQDKATSLSKTLQSLTDGSITDTDLIDLFQEYPDLAQYAGDTDKLKTELQKLIKQNPQDLIVQLKILKDSLPNGADKKQVEGLITSLQKLGAVSEEITATNFTSDEIIAGYESQYDKIIDKLNEEKDVLSDQKDILSEQKEELEDIISQYETAESVVEKYIDTQKSALEDEKTAIEDKYNAEIDAIQNANEEKQTAIDLQEKLDALNNGKKKKVNVYSESRGYNLQTDSSNVQRLQQDYDNAVVDNHISDLEKQRDNETAVIDNQIQEWEDYAQSWQDAVENIKNADDELTASKILGSDWTEKISDKDIGILNNFTSNYQTYQTKLSKVVDNEIEAVENSIDAKQDQIDMYTKEKSALSSYVKSITDKSNEYLDTLGKTADIEHSTLQGRVDFLNQCKEDARKALDWSDLNSEGIRQSGGYIVQYNGEPIGTAQDEAEAHNIRANYIGKILSAQLSTMNNVSSSDIIELQKQIVDRFNIIKPYKAGGVNDYTGLAMLHGTPNSAETIFNSSQAKKLYDLIANSDNLVTFIGNKVANGLSSDSIKNTKSNTYMFQFYGDIQTQDSLKFMQQMKNYIQRADLQAIIGR